MSAANHQSYDLTFIPADQLATNLATGLASLGQKLGHQKLLELTARVQGHASRNHVPKLGNANGSVSFLVDELQNDSRVDMTELQATYLRVTLSEADLEKIQRAIAAANLISSWAELSFDGLDIRAFDMAELDFDIDSDDPDVYAQMLVDRDLGRPCSNLRLVVSPRFDGEVWVEGAEKYGYAFSSPQLKLRELVDAFQCPGKHSNPEWVLLAGESFSS